MTAIVITRKSKNKCIIASERRCSDDDGSFYTEPRPKVRKLHGLLIGGAGSAAPTEVFMMLDKLEEVQITENIFHFLTAIIAPAWKHSLMEACLIDPGSEVNDENLESTIIICFKGDAFQLDMYKNGTIHTTELSLPASIGCGGPLGLAAFKALQAVKTNRSIATDLRIALEVVASMNNACDANIDIIQE